VTTTTTRDWSDVATAAAELAGNWRKFEGFVWYRGHDLPDAADWLVWYTGSPQSGLIEESNRAVMTERLAKYAVGDDPDLVFEQHSHWVVGHMDGFSVRVLGPDGAATDAFREFCRLQEALDGYPILHEQDYSDREYAATLENYAREMWPRRGELPPGWEAAVYGWFEGHGKDCFIESRDDRGGYAPREALLEALEELRLVPVAAVPM